MTRQLEIENAASGNGSEQDITIQEDTVSLVKNIISSEFRDLKKQLLEKQVNPLTRKSEEERSLTFTYNGNQKQSAFKIHKGNYRISSFYLSYLVAFYILIKIL